MLQLVVRSIALVVVVAVGAFTKTCPVVAFGGTVVEIPRSTSAAGQQTAGHSDCPLRLAG